VSLIEKSFRYLAKIARLGEFWSGVYQLTGPVVAGRRELVKIRRITT